MKAKLYLQAICPKCNRMMLRCEDIIERKEPSYIKCVNPDCKLYDIKYKLPTVKLEVLNTRKGKGRS